MQEEHWQNRADCVVNWNCRRIRVLRDVTLSLGEWFPTFRRIPEEEEGTTALYNIRNCPSKNIAPYSSRTESPVAPLWQSRIVLWSHMRREALTLSRYICILWNYVRGNITNSITVARHPLLGRGLLIIEASRSHLVTPHTVGLLSMNDQLVTETFAWWHTILNIDIYVPAGGWGVRSHNPSIRATANPRLWSRGHLEL